MLQKTVKLLQLHDYQKQQGHDDDLAEEMKDAIEDEIQREDHRVFYGGNPAGEQMKPIVGKLLKEKSAKYEERSREGARGTH